jgi:hypothetical protein
MTTVITHNGQPPGKGGRRLGYQVDGFYVSLGSETLDQLIARFHAPATSAVARKPSNLPVYSSIAYPDSGWCPYCDTRIGVRASKLVKTDEGERRLITCPNCCKLLLPR